MDSDCQVTSVYHHMPELCISNRQASGQVPPPPRAHLPPSRPHPFPGPWIVAWQCDSKGSEFRLPVAGFPTAVVVFWKPTPLMYSNLNAYSNDQHLGCLPVNVKSSTSRHD